MAHGFIKGLLFLGSGSVIHAVDGEQDMDSMGALRTKIPITHWTFLIGALASAGIPPLAGFFSKDAVLGESFMLGFQWVWIIGAVVALMTAFYMFRLMGKTFYGESHVDPAVEPHVHESPRSMTVPLILLAGPSLVAGAILGLPLGASTIFQWLEPVFHPALEAAGVTEQPYAIAGIDGFLILVSVAVATLGMVAAWRLFGFFSIRARLDQVRELTARVPRLYLASFNKWWFDDLYDLLFDQFGGKVANARPGSTSTSSTASSTASRR